MILFLLEQRKVLELCPDISLNSNKKVITKKVWINEVMIYKLAVRQRKLNSFKPVFAVTYLKSFSNLHGRHKNDNGFKCIFSTNIIKSSLVIYQT